MRIAFDIDDTLIVPSVVTGGRDVPNYETIGILKWFQSQGHTIILWSGSGQDWAKNWGEKLGLEPFTVILKDKNGGIDVAFDDCDVDLATMNIKVKRIKNSISRKEWNETKRKGKK
jgi:hydroxymethylpyrimidine pyrophosphatase-like HAD family hydrolase